jgi:hypothetical protein
MFADVEKNKTKNNLFFVNSRSVCLLLKRGADPLLVDKLGVDPISIAIDNCQPNIVTM